MVSGTRRGLFTLPEGFLHRVPMKEVQLGPKKRVEDKWRRKEAEEEQIPYTAEQRLNN